MAIILLEVITMNGMVVLIIGVVVFAVMLPVMFNVIYPTYTLNSVTNESVTISANKGQLTGYPVDSSFTPIVSNRTNLFTTSSDYNITASTGAMTTGGAIKTTPINVTYKYQPASYLTSSTDRSIASIVFTMVLVALLVSAAFFVGKGGM